MEPVTKILRTLTIVLMAFVGYLLPWALLAQDSDPGWPREFATKKGSVVVYQPQAETFKNGILTGRAAMAIKTTGKDEPVFGALWFKGRVNADKDSRTATLTDLDVTKVRWTGATAEQQENFSKLVEAQVPAAGIPISMDRLSASLAVAEREAKSAAELKNDPPRIVFTNELSVLLLYDGEPRMEKIGDSPYERVANTPMLVVRDSRSRKYLLCSGKAWYSAGDPKGPWQPGAKPSNDLLAMLPPDSVTQAPALARPPKIVVATEPTELVVFNGEPEWKPLPDGDLLYATNTETVVTRDLASNNYFVLVSGRWFKSGSAAGPWTFVRSDQLPAGFKKIPVGSDIGQARVAVAGTGEAEDALLDAEIPQTAAIDRKAAKLEVVYDGPPQFEAIQGTSVEYAANTGTQVLRIDGLYYAVDNGVWFTSDSPAGPWEVSDRIPEEKVQTIPPSAPVYNVTHVHVYESTPDIVYVGYTPGYLWSFPCYGSVVYGTGYHYRPWRGIYYPRPLTWGMHVHYDPWFGWRYGMSWWSGFYSAGYGFGWGYGGYYRPGYYRPAFQRPGHWYGEGGWYGPGGYRRPVYVGGGNSINIGNQNHSRPGYWSNKQAGGGRPVPGVRPGGVIRPGPTNIYNRRDVRDRVVPPSKLPPRSGGVVEGRPGGPPGGAQGRPTSPPPQITRDRKLREQSTFSDRDGNVLRSTKDRQWEVRQEKTWTRDTPAPSTNREQLDRDRTARERGAARQEKSPPPSPRPSPGSYSRPPAPPPAPAPRPVTPKREEKKEPR
jgi:hypothetical protein